MAAAVVDSPSRWLALIGAAAVGLALVTVARWVHVRVRGFLPEDVPGGPRKHHRRATPMVGFLLAGAAVIWLLLGGEAVLAGALSLLAVIGMVDDRGKGRGGLHWKTKAIGQLVAAAAIAAATVPRADLLAWLVVLGFAFVLVNAVNFLDNMDGVATLVGGVGVLLASLGHGTLAVAGAVFLGLLPWNWPRARMFLGDGGALPLGGLLAAAAVRAGSDPDGTLSPLLLVAPAFVPLLDFAQVVCARLWLGYAPWVGDRRHLTHIATYLGLPSVWVAPLLGGVAVGAWFGLTALT